MAGICARTSSGRSRTRCRRASRDRCTKAHEYLFLLSKSERYFYDADAIKEDGQLLTSGNTQHKYVDGDPMDRTKAGFLEHAQQDLPKVNKRSVWEVATQPFAEAHFATFPPDLIEPCIKAGTSEKGCCSKCGKPWVREIAQVDTGRKQKMADGWDTGNGAHGTIHRDGRGKGETGKPVMAAITLGWSASCTCAADVVPCTVLDPFGGAGTTGLVADRLGCNALLIELSPEYLAMAERRIRR